MNDFYDDFEGDFDDGFDNGDRFDETFSESEMDEAETDKEDIPLESKDHSSGIGWQDWMLLGPISEDIAREKAEQERLIRENYKGSENED